MTRSVHRQADERRTAAEKGIVVAAPSGRDAGTVPAVTRGATLPSELRRKIRVAHLENATKWHHIFLYGGPLLNDRSEAVGSVIIVSVPDQATLDQYMREEPYFHSDLFESLLSWPSRQVVPEVAPGRLQAELERQRELSK